jgi:hypothetical protein
MDPRTSGAMEHAGPRRAPRECSRPRLQVHERIERRPRSSRTLTPGRRPLGTLMSRPPSHGPGRRHPARTGRRRSTSHTSARFQTRPRKRLRQRGRWAPEFSGKHPRASPQAGSRSQSRSPGLAARAQRVLCFATESGHPDPPRPRAPNRRAEGAGAAAGLAAGLAAGFRSEIQKPRQISRRLPSWAHQRHSR